MNLSDRKMTETGRSGDGDWTRRTCDGSLVGWIIKLQTPPNQNQVIGSRRISYTTLSTRSNPGPDMIFEWNIQVPVGRLNG